MMLKPRMNSFHRAAENCSLRAMISSRRSAEFYSLLGVLLTALTALPGVAQLSGTDNFNDSMRDVAKWGSSDTNFGRGRFVQTNAVLTYFTTNTPSLDEDDEAVRIWATSLSFSNDWSAQMDIRLPALNLAIDQEAWVNLRAADAANLENNAGIELGIGRFAPNFN